MIRKFLGDIVARIRGQVTDVGAGHAGPGLAGFELPAGTRFVNCVAHCGPHGAASTTASSVRSAPIKIDFDVRVDPDCPKPGERYEHYKGGRYAVVCGALRESDLETLVVYKSDRDGTIWSRPLVDFLCEVDGGPRFRRIERQEGEWASEAEAIVGRKLEAARFHLRWLESIDPSVEGAILARSWVNDLETVMGALRVTRPVPSDVEEFIGVLIDDARERLNKYLGNAPQHVLSGVRGEIKALETVQAGVRFQRGVSQAATDPIDPVAIIEREIAEAREKLRLLPDDLPNLVFSRIGGEIAALESILASLRARGGSSAPSSDPIDSLVL